MTVYVLDTNVISDIVAPNPISEVVTQIADKQHHTLCLCEAVDYEVRRGYLRVNATTRLEIYDQRIKPQFQWIDIENADWRLV